MRKFALAAVALTVFASAAFAQESDLMKEDVVKLVKAGVSDDVIVAKIEQAKASFKLSADEIAQMKQDGVSDRVLKAMLDGGQAQASGEGTLVVQNESHRTVKVTLGEGVVDFSLTDGEGLKSGGRQELSAKGAEVRIAVGGARSRHTAKLPATLRLRGAEMEYLDVVTLTIEDANGSTIMILHSVGKEIEGHRWHPSVEHEIDYGPQMTYLPFVVDNVLLGAGIGAIWGRGGCRSHGSIIGDAAWTVIGFGQGGSADPFGGPGRRMRNGGDRRDGKGGRRDNRHGNNGLGNGEDPAPPGNPRENDGPGTGPGNPGNRGGNGGGNGNGGDNGKGHDDDQGHGRGHDR